MEEVGIFIFGSIMTLFVVVALSLLFAGAVMDGRTQQASEKSQRHGGESDPAVGELPRTVGLPGKPALEDSVDAA